MSRRASTTNVSNLRRSIRDSRHDPVRIALVIGAFIGARYLKESDAKRRVWAAVAMSAGVIALALG